MADIRINALATTATTPASDDYLALDGTAQGTRKILATNIANNVTDVILGASGPSVKSSLSARAPRQGLVFDGTAGADVASVPAFGTGDFTFAAWVNQSSLAAAYLCSASAAPDSAFLYLVGNGTFQWWSNGAARATSSASAFVANKWILVVATRTGGTTTLYANGVSVGSGADSQNLASAINRIGQRAGGTNILNGSLIPLIYNRALSASEVVALYEAGAPAGADYNSASNTTFVTGFTQSGSITSFTANATSWSGTGTAYAEIYPTGAITSLTVGKRYRLAVGTVTGTISASGGVSGSALTSNTTYDFTATATSVVFSTSTVGSIGITGISITKLGLLLAPDAAQAGGGLTWYDTSGNAANITLPASGVSWNVPWASTIPGAATVASASESALSLTTSSASGNSRLLRLITSNSAATNSGFTIESAATNAATRNWGVSSNNTAYGDLAILQSNALGGNPLTAGTIALYVAPSRNFLLGTTTDSSNGKLQLATHTTSAGGIGFGTDWSLYRVDQYSIGLNGTAGGSQLRFYESGTLKGLVGTSAGNSYLDSLSGSIIFRTNSGTTALTLDSSQNATFAQGIVVQNSDCTLYRSTTATLTINNNFNIVGLLRTGSSTPANASGAGVAGTITWDASYIYVCTAANTWKRVAIATW